MSWFFGPKLDKNLLPGQIKYVRQTITNLTREGKPEKTLYKVWDLEVEKNIAEEKKRKNPRTNPEINHLLNWRNNPYGSIYHIVKEGETLPTEPHPPQLNVPLNKAGQKVIQQGDKYVLVDKGGRPITDPTRILGGDTNEVEIDSLYVLVNLDGEGLIATEHNSYFVPISKVYLKSDGNPVAKNVRFGSGIDAGSRIEVSFRPEYNEQVDKVTLRSLGAIAVYVVIPDGRKDKQAAGRKRTVRRQRRQRSTRRYLKLGGVPKESPTP